MPKTPRKSTARKSGPQKVAKPTPVKGGRGGTATQKATPRKQAR